MTDSVLLNTDDLLGFNKAVTVNSTPYMVSQGLAQWQPDMSTWSPAAQGLTSFGKSFLQGFLQNQARSNAAQQTQSVMQVMPQLMENPAAVAVPEGVNPEAFNTLKGIQMVKNAQLEQIIGAENRKSYADMLKTVIGEGVKNGTMSPESAMQAVTTGKLPTGEAAAVDPLTNPNSPQYKLNKDIQERADRIESEANSTLKSAPIAQNYQVRLSSLQNILANVNNNTAYGDLAMINGFVKIQDPEGSIREGDVQTVQGAQDRLSRFFGDTKAWFTSDGRLKPEYRKQIAQTSINTVNSFGKVYQDYADQVLKAVEAKGGIRSNVAYVPAIEFDVNNYFKAQPLGGTDLIARINAELAKKGRNPDGSVITAPLPSSALAPR